MMLSAALLLLMTAAPQAPPPVEALVRDLRSDRIEVREQAELSLKLRGGDDLAPALEKLIGDPDEELVARVQGILKALPRLRALTPNLEAVLPGSRAKLARNPHHVWTEVFLEASAQTGTKRRHPGIVREDLLPLAPLALRAAEPGECILLCKRVAAWRLNSAIPELAPLVTHADWNVRSAASEAAESCRARSLAPELLKRLRAESAVQRSPWIDTLVNLGCREVVPEITVRLLSPGNYSQADLAWHLITLDAGEAVPALVKAVRMSADLTVYLALRQLAPREALSAVVGMLDDRAPYARERALWLMQSQPSAAFTPALLKLLEDKEASTRAAALAALRRQSSRAILPEVRKRLDDDSTAVRRAAALLLASQGDKEAFPELAMLLRDPGANPHQVYEAGKVLGRSAAPELLSLLDNPTLAGMAAEALAESGVQEARKPIAKLLGHSSADVRRNAVQALVKLEGRQALPLLLPLLKDPDKDVRRTLYYHLDTFAPEELRKQLRGLSKEGSPVEQEEASNLLADLEGSKEPADFEKELESDDPGRRSNALGALLRAEVPDVVAKLKVLLTDPDRNVRDHAARALAGLGERDGLRLLMLSSSPGPAFTLNALRHPEVWKSWREKTLATPPPAGTSRALIQAVAKEMGVAVEGIEAADEPGVLPDFGGPLRDPSALAAISRFGGTLGFVLEPGRLRVMSGLEFQRLFKGWYAGELLKSPREEDQAEGRLLSEDLQAAARVREERMKASGAPGLDPSSLRSLLSPALRAMPGVEDRLIRGGDEAWTELFLEVGNVRQYKEEFSRLGEADLNPLTLRALRGAVSPEEKSAVLQAVIRLGLGQALPLIPRLLDDPAENVRVSAAHALFKLEGANALPKVDRLFEDPSASVRTRLVEAAAAVRLKEAVPRILSLKQDPAIRRGIAFHGEALGIPETLPCLFELMTVPDYHERMRAMFGLSPLAGPEWNRTFIELMKRETDPQVLWLLIRQLGQNGAREAVPEILALMKRPNQFLSEHFFPDILRTLGQLAVPDGIPVILSHLEEGNFKPEAAIVAGEMGLKAAVPLLRAQLGSEHEPRLRAAAEALARLGDGESVPVLRRLLAHPKPEVRGSISLSLAMLGDRESLPRILEIAREGASGIGGFSALLHFPGRESRAELLERVGSADLSRLPSPWIRHLGEALMPLLLERMKSDQDLSTPLNILGRLGTPAAAELIRPMLDHRNEYSRFRAAEALCRMGDREAARRLMDMLPGGFGRIPPLVLNAVRSPGLWRRLDGTVLPRAGYASSREHCERIAAAAGLALEGLPSTASDFPAWEHTFVRLMEWGQPPTALEALEQLIVGRWTVVLDEGRLRILGRADAVQFWNRELKKDR